VNERIRVLVVDDSALMRKLIPQILERDKTIEVVGTAMDGAFGLRKIEDLRPDVVTLDLEMPRMDGMETLRQITKKHRVPVIIVSALSTEGAAATFKALALGALDFVAKPRDAASAHMDDIAEDLIRKIKIASKTKNKNAARPVLAERPKFNKPLSRTRREATKIIVIGVSTGGPYALQYLLSQLPGDFPGSIVIVQHMPEGFTEMFSRRLNECCAIDVKEAQSGDLLIAGRALICPGDRHIKVRRMPLASTVVLSDEERVNGHRPSVDVLFRSAAEFGNRAIGVLMTGMGDDGADGMGVIKDAGGLTIAQTEDTCVVFGMPKAAIERGFAMRVVALELLANALINQCSPGRIAKEERVHLQL
jgi:two-component system, chemotaxis family, protein-glutamate methylesterase/glutaminase